MIEQLFVILLFISSLHPFIAPNGEDGTNELISQGRVQYQLLQERGNLPRYGLCWKSALEAVDKGCQELSEETQSDVALALTNCFLDMSGLEIHHCEMDRKENLRRICISSMSDKAFNVYTEFYTHTLNMCWFLRGQIWQEALSENTLLVGKQLESSARKQELLLGIQKESLIIQNKVLQHGKDIESILSDLNEAAQNHKEMLLMLGQAINALQSWLIGEVSWINTLIFYISFSILFIILTSTPLTITSRLPILILLVINLVTERGICACILSKNDFQKDVNELYGDINDCVQFLRYCFVIISFCILFYRAYFYEDTLLKNKKTLDKIFRQNQDILVTLKMHRILVPDKDNNMVYKSDVTSSFNHHNSKSYTKLLEKKDYKNGVKKFDEYSDLRCSQTFTRVRATSEHLKYNLRSNQNTPKI